MVPVRDLVEQLGTLGVERGGVLVVHAAFSKVRPVEDGPAGLIRALREAVGETGTLVMPSMSDDDEEPFDPAATPCRSMGVVADTFWRLPGVLRSDSPHAFAAWGPKAQIVTAPHPHDVPHGMDSPVGRAFELDAQVLLIGAGHDANTTVHLAEAIAGVRYRQTKHLTLLVNGKKERVEYGETDHCCMRFDLVGDWLEAKGLEKRGAVGHAAARLSRSRAIVDVAVARLREDETVFLHPPGVDEECDAARASIPASRP